MKKGDLLFTSTTSRSGPRWRRRRPRSPPGVAPGEDESRREALHAAGPRARHQPGRARQRHRRAALRPRPVDAPQAIVEKARLDLGYYAHRRAARRPRGPGGAKGGRPRRARRDTLLTTVSAVDPIRVSMPSRRRSTCASRDRSPAAGRPERTGRRPPHPGASCCSPTGPSTRSAGSCSSSTARWTRPPARCAATWASPTRRAAAARPVRRRCAHLRDAPRGAARPAARGPRGPGHVLGLRDRGRRQGRDTHGEARAARRRQVDHRGGAEARRSGHRRGVQRLKDGVPVKPVAVSAPSARRRGSEPWAILHPPADRGDGDLHRHGDRSAPWR